MVELLFSLLASLIYTVYIVRVIALLNIIWGAVTKTISQNKGYEGGFWWGFFLHIIGLIVVLARPDNPEGIAKMKKIKPFDYSYLYNEQSQTILDGENSQKEG